MNTLDTQKAMEILHGGINSASTGLPKHNLLDMISNVIIVDDDILPIPQRVIERGTSEFYLDKCDKYINIHDPLDFKLYWGISPEDYPLLYEDPIYSIARLCYLLTDCHDIKSWSQCWNHKGENNVNYVISIDGKAKVYYNNLYHQLKTEIPEKKIDSGNKCSLCHPTEE